MQDYTNTSVHFKEIKNIGEEGRNSTVFIAHDWQLDTNIVVKSIKKEDFRNSDEYFHEAKKLYSSTHPNIVPVQYSCQDDENIYITMPLFAKGSVNKMAEKTQLSISEVVRLSIDFLCGLHHIHTKNLLHCDVKPTNILISDSNDGVLTDFGLAKYLKEDGTATADKLYTIHRAPETLMTNAVSRQSDIYQAGLTIYRMCNGNSFFKDQLLKFARDGRRDMEKLGKAISEGKFPDRSSYLPHVPQTLRNYIRRALDPNPLRRYESVLDLLNDLAGIELPFNWKISSVAEKSKKWICQNELRTFILEMNENTTNSWSVVTTKQVGSGKPKKIHKYCEDGLDENKAWQLAKKAMNDDNLGSNEK